MRPRIYLDTSVIGGCLDAEFRSASNDLLSRCRTGKAVAVISDLTMLELHRAPARVEQILWTIPRAFVEPIYLGREAADLARQYVEAKVVGEGRLSDAQHIAVATVGRVDVLVSWNFRHIVNLGRIRGYNAVNLRMGYPLLEIRSPLEVMDDETEEKGI